MKQNNMKYKKQMVNSQTHRPQATNHKSVQRRQRPGNLLVGLLFLLLLPTAACGFLSNIYQTNNLVRQTVYEYETRARGKTDDLILDFQRDEPRVKFEGQNENGGRTVWLYRLGAEEFFALRPPDKTYLYIQNIDYNDDRTQATVTVYRGDGAGYQGRTLTLAKNDASWRITQDVAIKESDSQ